MNCLSIGSGAWVPSSPPIFDVIAHTCCPIFWHAFNTSKTLPPSPNPQAPLAAKEDFPLIDGYTITRKLGQGGQGAVYLALQASPRRKVAIKILLNSPFAAKSAIHRFEREIELVATLRHPNIVTVFDTGKTRDGHLFYVMAYIRGIPLTDYIRSRKLPMVRILELLATACEAVNHAHQKGVMHRDLKPANILVDDEGNLHVLDFGMAK